MKIAILIRKYIRSAGGAERYCVELTEKLAINNEVHVFAQEYENDCDCPQIQFHKISKYFERPRFINQLLFSWLTKRATKGRFNIVHSHELVSHANIYTIHVPCFRSMWIDITGFRKILRFLNTAISPRKILYLWLEKIQMKQDKKKHFISVSKYLSRNIHQCYPLVTKISIANPGLSQSFVNQNKNNLRSNLLISDDSFLMLLVANDFKKKGLLTIIKSMEILNNNRLHLIVAGNGKVTKKFNSKSISSNIHFLGSVKDISSLYSEVNLLVHPTSADTFGMAPLEAMSMNLPVIISSMEFCGFTELLTSSEALILDNPRDEIELSDKINFIYHNEYKRLEIARNGFEKSKTINWENTLKKTLEAYNSIL
jgi:glycosyltransferase involved in cell wall biosynthesis